MIRITGTVVYRDGRRVAFTGGPRELVAWEAFALGRGLPTTADEPGRGAPYTMVYFLAWTLATREPGAAHRFRAVDGSGRGD